MKSTWMNNAVVGTQVPDVLGAYVNLLHFHWGVERCASNGVAPDIHHNRESMNACPSHSHRSAIGPDNPRFGAKCAIDPAATDQSKFGGRNPGQPGGKSGPAVKPSTATTGSGAKSGGGRNQERPKFPDCREARAVQQSSHPRTQPRPRSRRRLRPAREGRWRDTDPG